MATTKKYQITQLVKNPTTQQDELNVLHPETEAGIVKFSERTYSIGEDVQSAIEATYALAEQSASAGVTSLKGTASGTTAKTGAVTIGSGGNITPADMGLSTVATSGSYNDLSNKPTIPSVGTLKTDATTTQTPSASESFGGNITLHKVSKTGSYSDLLDKPSIPTVGTLDTNNTSAQTVPTSAESLGGAIKLHKVSKTGSYSDLNNKPSLGTASAKDYTTSVTSESNDLVTSGAVYTAIDNLPEPMIFKGSLGTGGTITTLPTASSSNEGFVYKVITDGTYASQSAKVGDTFISNGSAWVLIPSGDEPSGTVTSVGVSASSGSNLSVSGSPVTSSGTITIGVASGYSIPSTTKQGQWDAKQDALSSQTAYTSKGSATKVPQITTNALGQVTGITEVTITQPNVGTLVTNATTGQTASSGESFGGTITLHKVSKTGSYNDLLDKPTIPSIPDITIANATGNGNAITSLSASGHTITPTKGKTFLEGNQTITLQGDVNGSGATSITTTLANVWQTAPTTAFSSVSVNQKGLVTAGGQIIEVGATNQVTPSATLAYGGIFFKEI